VDCRPARRFNDPKKRVLPEEETALKRPEIAEPEVGRQTGGQADRRVRGGINEDEKRQKNADTAHSVAMAVKKQEVRPPSA
jgi:hypothetical protein